MSDGTLSGMTLGSYRVVTLLGEGGTGEVYFAEHQYIGRRAAIKVLKPAACRDPDLVQRFIAEARAVNDIRHPNIVEIDDCGEVEGRPYLVMELLEGHTLGERLQSGEPVGERQAFAWMSQAASALAAAHQRRIIHRDVKPENIFLCRHPDGSYYVKLLDFGIAKLQDAHLQTSGRTATGVFLGTPHYMSPEQCLCRRDLDARSDIYSAGVVLYEMLAGEPPFNARSPGPLLVAHINQQPTPLRQKNPEVSAEAEALVMRALRKDREQRFSTMYELRQAMQAVVEGAPLPVLAAPAARALSDEGAEQDVALRAERVAHRLAGIIEERVRAGRLKLPVLPSAVQRALALLDDHAVPIRRAATALEDDPLLAAQVLKVANSPAFMGVEPAASLEQAVSRLGASNLRAVLVEASARGLFMSKVPQIRRDMERIWAHSVAVACAARRLTELRPLCGDGGVAYLAGLLHDVGKPITGALLTDVERYLATQERAFMDHEMWRRVVSESHHQVGVAVAEAWNLAPEIAQAITGARTLTEDALPGVVACVALANALAKRALPFPGLVDHADNDALIARGAAALGLTDADLEALLVTCQRVQAA